MIPRKPKKTTVREELENWNVVFVLRKLNAYYTRKINNLPPKSLQGMEAKDFSMHVISKIVSGERSWENSNAKTFMDFCYGVAKSELSTWRECKYKTMIPFDIKQENKSNLHIRDDYEGNY